MDLTIFDVEHGACALLTSDTGTRLMLDCGHNASTGWTPGQHLYKLGATRLDVLMITNYDEDHVSGFRDLDERVFIEWMFRNRTVNGPDLHRLKSDTGMGAGIAHLARRVAAFVPSANPLPHFPRVSWEVFWNEYPHDFDDENNLSMVVKLVVDGIAFLFPGDMECAGWRQLFASNPAFRSAVANIDVLVASHHGRDNGICPDLFDNHGCKPAIVVISDDYHKYDTQKTTGYYGSKCRGISFRGESRRVLTTRMDGDIHFSFSASPGGNWHVY